MITFQFNSRLVGYARVSTTDQERCLQIDALRQLGVKREHLFCDKISGAKEDRPDLPLALKLCNRVPQLLSGDWIDSFVPCVTWSTTAFGSTTVELLREVEHQASVVCEGSHH
jgi:predicted site-specific integrase-resolvase